MGVLASAVNHYRSTFSVLLLLMAVSVYSYFTIPLEATPRVKVPYVLVSVVLFGVSPEDASRLLVRPIEKELRAVEGIEEVRAVGRESVATVIIKFEAGAVKSDKAVNDVRVAVDRAKAELPIDAEEPIVKELTADDFPAITIAFSMSDGATERMVFQTAQMIQREVEGLSGVLEATLSGEREELVEIVLDPSKLENYGLTAESLAQTLSANNLLIPAGDIDYGRGRFPVKVPALIEQYEDVASIPVLSNGNGTILLSDVAEVRRTFKDAMNFSNFNGEPAILLEVNKRVEANQIEVAALVREKIAAIADRIPRGVTVSYAFDLSQFSRGLIEEMRGNILTAVVLVMVIVVGALGFKTGVLVGLGIPFSLLLSLIALHALAYSFNFLVMFGMLLALGMLIDGPIVISEFANRKMAEGLGNKMAYMVAVRRMFWPVMASTATTLAAFLPMMFWPGIAGDFMKYLPVTVFSVLLCSLAYALFFAPVLGSLLPSSTMDNKTRNYLRHLEEDDPLQLGGYTGAYARGLYRVIRHPLRSLSLALLVVFAIFEIYGANNNGVIFFAETEETAGIVAVRAQGNLSVEETRRIVADVEKRLLTLDEVKLINTRSGGTRSARIAAKDEVANILVELHDPKSFERSTREVFEEMREITRDIPGIYISAEVFEGGPQVGKPIQIQLESINREKLLTTTRYLQQVVESQIEGTRDVTDTTPLPGIQWEMEVDRALAAQMGVNILQVGRAIQLVTDGLLLAEYRPDDANDEIEIRLRYPEEYRGLKMLQELTVSTPQGPVPVSTFVNRVPKPKVDKVERVDYIDIMSVQADVQAGYLADNVVKDIQAYLEKNPVDPEVQVVFRGANEEQENSLQFLALAFLLALFLMYVLLVTQFNSFYQAFLILSSVVLSTAGVLLGLLMTGDPFSTIMTGVGVVALAGIVVNNNIVLIDTYNEVYQNGDLSRLDAAVRACAQRLRPIFLTTTTTILGLLPLAAGYSIDLVGREVVIDGVVSSYFIAVARAIVFGLFFATIMTLFLTPVMLVLPGVLKDKWLAWRQPKSLA